MARPRSMSAWFHEAGSERTSHRSAARRTSTREAAWGSVPSTARATTRATLVSMAGIGAPKANEAIAAAV
jgi:hypothetical protein